MAPRTLPIFVQLAVARTHVGYTYRRLRSNALTKALPVAEVFKKLYDECGPLQQKEMDLDDAIDDCSIDIDAADRDLDTFAERLGHEVLVLTDDNRQDPLYTLYFGDKPMHAFIRPVMSEQLAAMSKWPDSLATSEHEPLKKLAPELPPLLNAAKKALDAKASAEQKRSDFRQAGERKDYLARLNTARKEAHGILATLPHKYKGLALNFADQFFRRERSKSGDEVTLKDVEEELEALKAEVVEKEALRDALKESEDTAAKKAAAAKATREAAEAELSALKKERAANEKKTAALRALIKANS